MLPEAADTDVAAPGAVENGPAALAQERNPVSRGWVGVTAPDVKKVGTCLLTTFALKLRVEQNHAHLYAFQRQTG